MEFRLNNNRVEKMSIFPNPIIFGRVLARQQNFYEVENNILSQKSVAVINSLELCKTRNLSKFNNRHYRK